MPSTARNHVYYIYWVLTLPIIFGLFGYYLFGIIRQYANSPYSTRIMVEKLQYFPTIDLCPDLWFDLRKARKVTYGNDALLGYILRFTEWPIPIKSIDMVWKEYDKSNLTELEASYNKIRSHYGSHTALVRAITLDPLFFIRVDCTGCNARVDPKMQILFKDGRACFRLENSDIDYSTVAKSDRISIMFHVNQSYTRESLTVSSQQPHYADGSASKLFYLEESSNWMAATIGSRAYAHVIMDPIVLTLDSSYDLYLDIVAKSILQECSHSVIEKQRVEYIERCIIDNFKETCSFASCILFKGPEPDLTKQNLTLCHTTEQHIYNKVDACIETQFRICDDNTVLPCYDTIMNIVPQLLNQAGNGAKITVYPPNGRSILHIAEFDSFTWNSLVSNVGGLFGMFLGISIYSLASVMYTVFHQLRSSLGKTNLRMIDVEAPPDYKPGRDQSTNT